MVGGKCLCGKVKYEVRGTPLGMYYCHCETCRKATGTAFATNIAVATDDFAITSGRELVKAFESSPKKYRYFCSGCGSPLYSQAEATKGMVSVRCGTLDDDPGLRPNVHFYVSSKAPWFEIHDDIPQQPKGLG
jgi:hypothetical protein